MVVLGRLSPEKRLAPPAGQHLKFHGDVLNPGRQGQQIPAPLSSSLQFQIPWIN